jgi:cytochrome P450
MEASLLSMNGPEHKRIRALVAPWFTPRAVDAVRPAVRAEAERTVDRFAAAGSCELIGDFAADFVAYGTCTFVGVPLDEIDRFMPDVHLLDAAGKDLASALDDCVAGLVRLTGYARSLLERRATDPRDDLLSRIAELVAVGELPPAVAEGLVAGLLSAGHAPTTNQIGLMVEVLSEHPDIWDALGAGTLEPPAVVEEVLRFRPTNQGVNRRVAEAFTYDGVEFAADEQVVVRLAAANRDPDRYPRPDAFDVEGNRGPHLAFGFGAHYCLGAALARLQLQEAVRALAGRLTCPTVVASRTVEGGGLVGPDSLELSFSSR